jgi:hypothetical protein
VTRLAATGVAALCLTGSAGAATGAATPWRTVAVPADGFSIAVPAAWQVVPRSTQRLNALIARLRKGRRTALELQFAEIAAARRATHTVYRFQAFVWPPPKGAVVPDVTVKLDPLRAGTTRDALPLIARQIVKALSRSAGATAAAPVARALPAGHAFEVTGTTRLSKSLRSRYAIYLLIHGGKLYSISFRGPATAVEGQVIQRFRFS